MEDLHATGRVGPYVNGQPAVDDFLIIVFLDDFQAIEIHDGRIGLVVKGVNQVVPICQAHGFQRRSLSQFTRGLGVDGQGNLPLLGEGNPVRFHAKARFRTPTQETSIRREILALS